MSITKIEGCEDATDKPELAFNHTFGWGRSTDAPARVLLDATVGMSKDPAPDCEPLEIPKEVRQAAERALSEIAGHIGLLCQSKFDIFSPRPYLFLEPESETEKRQLAMAGRIALPDLGGAYARVAPGGLLDLDFITLLADRPSGRALLSSALAAAHGIPKLHELIRLFENAFALAGGRLVKPLTNFLTSYPAWDLGYSLGEVSQWIINLRDPATHADLKRAQRVLFDSDVEPFLIRIEQAAYDVLFNKETWHSPSPRRLQRWSFASMNRHGDQILSATGGGSLAAWDDWDHFRAFRLNERCKITIEPSTGWKAVDWYFADSANDR